MDSYDTVISQMIHEQNMADEAMAKAQKEEDATERSKIQHLEAKVSRLEFENEMVKEELKRLESQNKARRSNLVWGNW